MSHRSYPRSWQERSGQVNLRPMDDMIVADPKVHFTQEREHPRATQFSTKADYVIIASKLKRGEDNKTNVSERLRPESAAFVLDMFSPDRYMRYRVNIFCKKVID